MTNEFRRCPDCERTESKMTRILDYLELVENAIERPSKLLTLVIKTLRGVING